MKDTGGGIVRARRWMAACATAVVAFLVPGIAAAVNLVGAISGSTVRGGSVSITFLCAGAPSCSGTYVAVAQDSGCSNAFTTSGAFTMTMSSDL